MIVLKARELPIQFSHVVWMPLGARIVGAVVQNGSPTILSVEDNNVVLRARYVYVATPEDTCDLVEDLPGWPIVIEGTPYVVFDDGEPDEADVGPGGS